MPGFEKEPNTWRFNPNYGTQIWYPTDNGHIWQREIIFKPFEWDEGYAVLVSIEETVQTKDSINVRRTPFSQAYYDKDYHYLIRTLLMGLETQDLNRKTADLAVWQIVIEILLKPKEKWLYEYFPRWMEQLERNVPDIFK